jgi:hypothetical protein
MFRYNAILNVGVSSPAVTVYRVKTAGFNKKIIPNIQF